MPDLATASALFYRRILEAETVVSNVEALWQTAPRGSDVRRQISEAELNALYEMSYLSIFGHWENFIEECGVRMLAGQGSSSYAPVPVGPGGIKTLRAARSKLLNGRRYLLWHDPVTSANRIARLVVGSPIEMVLRTESVQLEQFAAVRHAIAHRSDDSVQAFRSASVMLAGVAHRSPGSLLRTQDHSDPLNPVRWIRKISTSMKTYAASATA